jgi:hypothetical protein
MASDSGTPAATQITLFWRPGRETPEMSACGHRAMRVGGYRAAVVTSDRHARCD